MKTSSAGKMEIASHEGIVQMPYRDSVGVWTWGIGHTAAAGSPDPSKMAKGVATSLEMVFEAFARDLVKYEKGVENAVKVPLKQHQFDALVSFHYNTGAIGKASFVKKLNAGDIDGAADGMMAWKKPPEIIPRRKKEQELFRNGKYLSGGFANVYPANSAGKVLWSAGKRMKLDGVFGSIQPTSPVPPPPDIPAPEPKPVILDDNGEADPITTPKTKTGWAAFFELLAQALLKLFRKG